MPRAWLEYITARNGWTRGGSMKVHKNKLKLCVEKKRINGVKLIKLSFERR